jgi:ribosomal protein L29
VSRYTCSHSLTHSLTLATGRAWKADELRLKSFEDLHTLWYVLLKESNMLLSERERARKNKQQKMPQAERLLKVRQSMARIQCVLEERKRLHFRLRAFQREHLLAPATSAAAAAAAPVDAAPKSADAQS